MAKKPKPKKPEPVWNVEAVWFVWVKKTHPFHGKPYLDIRSVCTNEALAVLHRDILIRDEPDAEEIYIEKRVSDHLYAQRDVGVALRFGSHNGDVNRWERET